MSKRGNVISAVIVLLLFGLANYFLFETEMTHFWKHPIFNFIFCVFPISLVYIVEAISFLRQNKRQEEKQEEEQEQKNNSNHLEKNLMIMISPE